MRNHLSVRMLVGLVAGLVLGVAAHAWFGQSPALQTFVAAVTEPLWSQVKGKYRVLVTGAEALPPLDNVVGMLHVGDLLRALVALGEQGGAGAGKGGK